VESGTVGRLLISQAHSSNMQWNLGPEFIPHNGTLSVEKVKRKKKKEKKKILFPRKWQFLSPPPSLVTRKKYM
jgi:hypothetical protein